jgi:hypothetical protein
MGDLPQRRGGSGDQRFEAQALFRANGTHNSIVGALRALSS